MSPRPPQARGAGLSLARLSFDTQLNRRASLDAARITGRLLRASDIACRDEDGSILIAFTETDLVTAHVVARRIASVLKHTTLSLGAERTRLGPTVALAAFRARDTVETLVARTTSAWWRRNRRARCQGVSACVTRLRYELAIVVA